MGYEGFDFMVIPGGFSLQTPFRLHTLIRYLRGQIAIVTSCLRTGKLSTIKRDGERSHESLLSMDSPRTSQSASQAIQLKHCDDANGVMRGSIVALYTAKPA